MIGIFDSGFGGLLVFKGIYKLLPQYDYMYLGDSARAPYGNLSQEVIYQFTEESVDFLFRQGCEMIIIACGTASSEALKKIQQQYLPQHYPDRRVLGIIRPLAEESVKLSGSGKIGVVGTQSTIKSGAYRREINKVMTEMRITPLSPPCQGEKLEVYQQACPLLVPLVEEGLCDAFETEIILEKYLSQLREQKIDNLILGCTHYPVLFKKFQKIMGKNCNVLNSGEIVAASLQDYLIRHPEIEVELGKKQLINFYTTDDTDKFSGLGSKYFGGQFVSEKVKLK